MKYKLSKEDYGRVSKLAAEHFGGDHVLLRDEPARGENYDSQTQKLLDV